MNKNYQKGFGIVEIIVAMAIFVTIAITSVTILLQSFSINRLGNEETKANLYAQEGIEAVRSLKIRGWSNMDIGTTTCGSTVTRGLSSSGGSWAFSGTSDTIGKYTRTVTIANVCRDGSGNISDSGTSYDSDVKKVTTTIGWAFLGNRSDSVALTTYLSQFDKAIGAPGGVIFYGDSTTTPKFRTYDSSANTFGTETGTVLGAAARNVKVKTSPTKREAIAGYVTSTGTLQILCYNGSTWTNEWTAAVGGTGASEMRFGIAYETNTGDALVVYSTNATTSNEMAYRTKAGSLGCGSANWAAATNITAARTNGIIQWIRMESSPLASSNNIALSWADNASDLSAMIWTGAGFTIAEPSAAIEADLERVSASQDVQSFDIAVESTSGNLMVAWSPNGTSCTAGTNCIRYMRYTTSWQASAAVPTVADRATNIDISANPNSNEIILSAIDNSSDDLSTAYWSGSAWTGRQNVDTTADTPVAGSKLVANGWLINGATSRYIQLYMDASGTGISWYTGTGTGAPSKETDFATTPAIGDPKRWMEIATDPVNKYRLLFTISDTNSDLFSKRLEMTAAPAFTWTNSDGGALETSLGGPTAGPFGYAYWRNP